ncbi:uncharacterized protein LOC129950485 [Eupeodes corollae]|uniref:uncharacterized protein LOC129950485 n=1 Tax=Eupeodes corollae TaxID=290404 RepID=UPI00249039D7|nr:uncharacterized protein LOC129950485 [Eupeodes corollae]
MFTDFLRLMVGNVNIIVETNSGEVLFYTFYPYQDLHCRSPEPSIEFRYDNNISQKSLQFFPEKAKNFHRCPLRIRTRNELVLTLGNYTMPNQLRNYEMSILEYEILKELSLKMNFSFDIYHSSDSGLNNSLADGKFDVALGSFANDAQVNRLHSASVTYFMSWLLIALQRRPDVLRTLIWLLVPFNSTTWLCTLGFLILTTLCIVSVRRNKKLVSIFHLNNSGSLEILSVTIGASVEQLPRKTSLRFAFIVLSLGALILRSAYLGKLFDAYRGRTMVEPPKSVMELLAENYTIYAHDIFKPVIEDLIGSKNIHFENLQRYGSSLEILSDTAQRNAFVVSFIYIYTFHTAEQRKDIILKTVLRQQVCMFFQQHSIIVPRVNEIIMRMEEAGILHNLRQNYEELHHNTLSSGEILNKPIPLILERFEFTFYLFALLNSVAILIFVVELFVDKVLKVKY